MSHKRKKLKFSIFNYFKKIIIDIFWLVKENRNFLILFLIIFLATLLGIAIGFLYCLHYVKIAPIIIQK
ncbi:hypothetical protein J7J41_02660 [bacterium]|nr:hypothetical protein [bacterium]